MTNPDPSHITDAMWWLWEECTTFIPGVRLGGIYANKSGYHNSVNSNKKGWPGDYSIRLPLDLTMPDNKARAIDLTMDDNQMVLRTGYLIASAQHPEDNRLYGVREFYGTVDLNNVTGLSQTGTGDWVWVTSDDSHLWHDHISEFTEYADDMDAQKAIASVLSGQSWEDWNSSTEEGEDMAFIARDETGQMIAINNDWTGFFRVPKDYPGGEQQFLKDRSFYGMPDKQIKEGSNLKSFNVGTRICGVDLAAVGTGGVANLSIELKGTGKPV
jgi:hypothetical protein